MLKRSKALPDTRNILEKTIIVNENRKYGKFNYWAIEGRRQQNKIRVVVTSEVNKRIKLFSIIVLLQRKKRRPRFNVPPRRKILPPRYS